MSEYRFSLTFIFRYKNKIEDSVLRRENTGQRKSVFWHILPSGDSIMRYFIQQDSELVLIMKYLINFFFFFSDCKTYINLIFSLSIFFSIKQFENMVARFWMGKIYCFNIINVSSILA